MTSNPQKRLLDSFKNKNLTLYDQNRVKINEIIKIKTEIVNKTW